MDRPGLDAAWAASVRGCKTAVVALTIIDVCPDARDVPAQDLAWIDAHAARQGLSRTELMRRAWS
jgi:hypothetical protein